ncbi:MAG: WecB/TagA/CpsF family glycosyltransferase [Gammaproteobacteria bacterium]
MISSAQSISSHDRTNDGGIRTPLRCRSLLGYEIAAAPSDECAQAIAEWIHKQDRLRYFVCLNPHSIQTATRDDEFRDAVAAADLILPDGVGVILASRMLGAGIESRVTGFDIFQYVSGLLQQRGGARYFFLGSDSRTLEAITTQVGHLFPALTVVGTYSPPFADDFTEGESERMIEIVNRTEPDILWLGLSAPKQEKWLYRYRHQLSPPVAAPIGAVFDYFAGTKVRPGYVARRLGLEWLSRLVQEPRRLWSRTAISAPAFVGHVVMTKIRDRR